MADNNEEINIEKQKEKKLGFFKKVAYSITKFEKYPEMAAEGTFRAFKYLVQIMLIFSIIVAFGLLYQFQSTVKEAANYIEAELPDITYSNGNLKVDSQEPITIDTENAMLQKIVIDTNVEDEAQIDEYVNSLPQDTRGAVILKDKAIIKSSGTTEGVVYTYTELLSSMSNQDFDNVTKQDMINYLTGTGIASIYAMFFGLMLVYVFVIYLVSVLVDTIVLSILGNITILFIKLKLKFSAVYNMAVYALTLPIILNATYMVVNMVTGFEIKYFQVMYTCVAYIYLLAAIFIIRADFVKKQGELMKIIEEQEKVKKEMKEKEQQEEEEKQKENKKPEKEDNKKDNQNKESEDGSEPSGSEA